MPNLTDLYDCSNRYAEYWTHVSSQGELPLADAAWRVRTLHQVDAFAAKAVGSSPTRNEDLIEAMAAALYEQPSSLHEFRLVASLSDKRLYLDLSYLFSRVLDPVDNARTLCGCSPSALTRHPTSFFENALTDRATRSMTPSQREMRRRVAALTIARYLHGRGVAKVLELYASLTPEARLAVLEHWLMPKEVQQNEAKRRGHGAEAQLARTLKQVGCNITPPNKDANPMGAYDPNISLETFEIAPRRAGRTFSSDIVILGPNSKPRVCIMSLVQSSDPGQFGVNKSDEIVTLRRLIDERNQREETPLELWGLVDGVGYSENKAGTVDKMLDNFHYFVQVKSSYKAALRAHKLGLTEIKAVTLDAAFYGANTMQQMSELYVPSDVAVVEDKPSGTTGVAAGKATVWVRS